MIHASKIDGKEYRTSMSMSMDEDRAMHNDKITLVWTYINGKTLTFVGWYYGSYRYNDTEDCINKYLGGK